MDGLGGGKRSCFHQVHLFLIMDASSGIVPYIKICKQSWIQKFCSSLKAAYFTNCCTCQPLISCAQFGPFLFEVLLIRCLWILLNLHWTMGRLNGWVSLLKLSHCVWHSRPDCNFTLQSKSTFCVNFEWRFYFQQYNNQNSIDSKDQKAPKIQNVKDKIRLGL